MKKILASRLIALLLFYFLKSVSFSQTIINYQTWTGASGCNIFSSSTNVPATINGSNGSIPHLTAIGQPTYDNIDKCVALDCNIINGSQNQGTEYTTTVNLKQGYSYKITINAAIIKPTQTEPNSLLRLDLNNGGNGGNTQCNGTGIIDASGSGGLKKSQQINSQTFSDYVFNYATLSSLEPYLVIAAIPQAGISNQTIYIRKITIEETPPTFTISANPPYTSCGSSTPVTFTINNPPVTGITGYNWNLGGTNNNWLYNGNPAPQNISTTTNTLILTPVCGKVPNAVGGIVTLNGANINTTNTASLSYYQPGLTINGNSNICSGSSNYYVNSLPCGANVTWSLSTGAPGVVSASCLSCNQTTLTRQGSGTVTLTANITNACGQTLAPITKTISTVNNTVIEGTYWLTLNGNWLSHGALNNNGQPITVYAPSNDYVQYGITLTTTGLTGVSWTVSGTGTIVSSGDTYFNYTINPPGNGASGVTVTLHATGPCGTVINIPYSVSVLNLQLMQSFTVSPNPATNSLEVTASGSPLQNNAINSDESKTTSAQRSITEIRIYDNSGILKKVQKENKTKQATVNLTGLKTGVYIIEITDGSYKERQQIIIQK
ncbi:MAG: T9SS type A sorting domain-containing protein [Ginsengibacter sp.]